MSLSSPIIPTNQLFELNLNGLNGRVLRIKNPKHRREIMIVYGHHTSLERIYGIAEDLSSYGNITVPDLPGFGGMASFYSINEESNFDALADYLASFIKMNYKRRRFSLVGFSVGFVIVTRMLQKYPEIAKQVDILVSAAGFTTKEDFKFSKKTFMSYKLLSKLFSGKISSWIFRYVFLNTLVLKLCYRFMPNARHRLNNLSRDDYLKSINFEIELWHNNDVRTYMKTALGMLTLNLLDQKVDLPVWHISVGDADQYFDNDKVKLHLEEIFQSCTVYRANMDNHMPSVIATKDESYDIIPTEIRQLLKSKKLRY